MAFGRYLQYYWTLWQERRKQVDSYISSLLCQPSIRASVQGPSQISLADILSGVLGYEPVHHASWSSLKA